jgi:adenosylmethionine-8-amino-7-oxononanoate aminotransferase
LVVRAQAAGYRRAVASIAYHLLADAADVNHIWLPATDMQAFAGTPLVIRSAKGMTLTAVDGREFLDGVSAAMVTSLGYSNPHVQSAISDQLGVLPFGPVLHGATEPAVALASKLASLLPGELDRAFLVSGGSEATETALKLARQHHVLQGRPSKTKVIARYRSYHGATRAAMAASGLRDKGMFEPRPAGFLHVSPPDCYRCGPEHTGSDCCADASLEQIAATIEHEGRDTVSAVIVDPIMAAAGVLVPPRSYYRRLRELCGEDVLLIFDEVLTGFGRTGHWFAADYYDVVPDIICLGKGMSGGFIPLAATVATKRVAEPFLHGAVFQHIHTFGGHPPAAAAGLAVIEEFERMNLVAHVRELGVPLERKLDAMAQRLPSIGDVRGVGFLWGIELVADRERRTRLEVPPGPRVVAHAMQHEQLLIRASRDVVQIAPALMAREDELDEIVARLERSIAAVVG